MTIYIGLLRGINVGGHNKLPMAELRALMGELGYLHVKTYIQSGNVVFQSTETDRAQLAESIRVAIENKYHFAPQIMILTQAELEAAIAANPFPEAIAEPKTLNLYFLASDPLAPDWERLERVRKESEQIKLVGRVFYIWTPDGIGRSKVIAQIERALAVPATGRNWRSANKVNDLAKSLEG